MAVAIRLRKEGSKDRPFFRVVVADSRARRDGRFIEIVGTYNPMEDGEDNYKIDLEKIDQWIANGAKPSDTVKSIIKRAKKAAVAAG
jgi:small subunit ribosomal protein S16